MNITERWTQARARRNAREAVEVMVAARRAAAQNPIFQPTDFVALPQPRKGEGSTTSE